MDFQIQECRKTPILAQRQEKVVISPFSVISDESDLYFIKYFAGISILAVLKKVVKTAEEFYNSSINAGGFLIYNALVQTYFLLSICTLGQ